MGKFQLTSPDGKKFEVEAPEGATEEQVLSYAQSQWKAPQGEKVVKPVEPVAPVTNVFQPSTPNIFDKTPSNVLPFPEVNPEALKSIGSSVAVNLARGAQTLGDIYDRPERIIAAKERDYNMKARALIDAGVPFSEAYKQVQADADAVYGQQLAEHEAKMAGNRAAVETALKDNTAQNPSSALYHTQGVLNSAAQNIPGIVASVITKDPLPGLALAGLTAFPQAYDTTREAGKSHEAGLLSGGLSAATEVALETWPLGGLLKDLGADEFGKMIMKFVGREVATEIPTTIVQDSIAQAINTPEKPFGEFVKETFGNVVDTAIQTPFAAALSGGFGHLVRNVGNKPQKEPLQETVEAMKEAAIAGDTAQVEVLHNVVQDGGDLNGQSLKQSTPNLDLEPDFLTPQREASLSQMEPLSEEEMTARLAGIPTAPVALEYANDGSSSLGVDEALAGQLTNTPKVVANAENYSNVNDDVPRSQRKILYGPEEVVGQPLGAVTTKAGTYTIGQATDERSADVLREEHDVYEALRQTFSPEMKIILSNESLGDRKAIGGMKRLDSGEYLIVPATARMFSATTDGALNADTFNPSTKAKVLYNAPHEFAHALYTERFFENVNPDLAMQFTKETSSGEISEATVAMFPPTEQALIREYLDKRVGLKGMNAATFQAEWMSPALAMQRQLIKNMKGYAGMPAESFVRRLVARNNPQLERLARQIQMTTDIDKQMELTAKRSKIIDALTNEYLSFDEYLAEQMSRYAHESGLLAKTGLASDGYMAGGVGHVNKEIAIRNIGIQGSTKEMYQKLLKSMQELFTALKRGIKLSTGQVFRIKSGVAFKDWLDSLTRTGQTDKQMTEIVGAKTATKETNKFNLPEEVSTEDIKALRRTITYSKLSPKQKQILYKLVRENAFNTAREEMVKMVQSHTRLQLDTDTTHGAAFAGLTEEDAKNPIIRASALREFRQKGFESKFFEAFFGAKDSENRSKVVSASGVPMLMSHATPNKFPAFGMGDIGFHFGTPLAAQARMVKVSPTVARDDEAMRAQVAEKLGGKTAKEGWEIINAFLNIRNPIKLSEDGATNIWLDPVNMANKLRDDGVISIGDLAKVWKNEQEFLIAFARSPAYDSRNFSMSMKSVQNYLMRPEAVQYQRGRFDFLRQMLQAKGYDGIQYENYVEGGTSWVAFEPGQIKTANGTFAKFKMNEKGAIVPSDSFRLQLDVTEENIAVEQLNETARVAASYEKMGTTTRALKWASRMQWYVLQQQQLAWIHPEFRFLDMAASAAAQYNASKSILQAQGDSVAQHWKKLGKETDAMLSRALEKEVDGGKHWTKLEQGADGKWTHVMDANTVGLLKQHGVDITTEKGKRAAVVYVESKNVLLRQFQAAQLVIAKRLAQLTSSDSEFELRLNELRKTFSELRNTPFLPRGDYGKFGLVVTEQKGLERKVVHRQMFESEKELIKARAYLDKTKLPGQHVREVINLADEHQALLALPAEYVDAAADALDLTKDQRDLMHDLLHPVKTDKLLAPYAKAMEKISGGSADRMRNFANFIWHNSTMIARTEAQPYFARAKNASRTMYNEVNKMEMDARARHTLLADIARAQLFMDKTTGYMLSPPNEWYSARSAVAIVYLWGSMKTALLNLTGLMTTVSAVTSQYGDIAGAAALAKAHKQLAELLTAGGVDKLTNELYNKAINEGHLVQSYAAHLAGAATAGTTRRLANRSRWMNYAVQGKESIAAAGMLPFTLAEQYTRRVTFLAVVNALRDQAVKAGKTIHVQTLYDEAVKQTDLLQNSYTLANRPQIMRGGTGATSGLLPLMTIFLSFMGHFTFNAAGGYTLGAERRAMLNGTSMPKSVISNTQRMLIMLLLLGGYEALPGMENILDILDVIMQKLTGKTVRQSIREGIQEVPEVPGASWVNDPRWWGKGLGGDVAGFDVSGSLGIGRLVPGTDALSGSPQNASEVAGKIMPAAFGVAGSLGMWSTQFLLDMSNGNDLTKNFTKFPGVVGGVSSAVEWSKNGVRGNKGEMLYEPSQAEIVGKALNFNPSGLTNKREEDWAKTQSVQYWTKRRQLLQKQFNRASDAEDREAIADVEAGIEKFNDSVKDPAMRLRPWQYHASFREHRKTQRQLEAGIVPRKQRNLVGEIGASFEDATPSASDDDVAEEAQ